MVLKLKISSNFANICSKNLNNYIKQIRTCQKTLKFCLYLAVFWAYFFTKKTFFTSFVINIWQLVNYLVKYVFPLAMC